MTSTPPSLLEEWKALQAASSSMKGPPSSEEELNQRKQHKARMKELRLKVSPEQWAELTKKPAREKALKKKQTSPPKPSKPLPPLLSPKEEGVSLGWTDRKHTFLHLLPFYSHTRRSKYEKYEDEEVFQGIDRRCFSNLYVDEERIEVPPLLVATSNGTSVNLMRHEFLQNAPGICSESFFQAAKCLHELDARFIMTELNAVEAAMYGQSRLVLTAQQRDYLIAAGADPDEFLEKSSDPKTGKTGWLRGTDGKVPRRSDWEDVKHLVMLHILRTKFCGKKVGPTTAKTVEAILSLSSVPLFVEHTRNDQIWGDHEDGNGFNLLGKTLSQVFLEISGEVPPVSITVGSLDALKVPNNIIVKYTSPHDDEPFGSEESGEEAPKVDCLLVLDFEATCDRGTAPMPQEIIEFPTLLVNATSGRVESKFHCYIKPDVHPHLSAFCMDLTGITQKQVNNGISLCEALARHRQWLDENGLVPLLTADGSYNLKTAAVEDDSAKKKKTFLYVTCGDWDLSRCLPNQLQYHGRKNVPLHFKHWINVKVAFRNMFGKKVGGMKGMLKELGLKLEGRHHSGIDDCRNIARICREMLDKGWWPKCTSDGRNR